MPVFIHTIETANPATRYAQDFARDQVKAQCRSRRARLIVHQIFSNSGIEWRHSAVGDFASTAPGALFRAADDGRWASPGTQERNDRFIAESKPLAIELARKTLASAPAFSAADVTHIITASCTGFYNPGMDFHIAHQLGLRPGIERYHLGFMGCYAAFPALRLARQICEANPSSLVLVLCLELCTLHLRLTDENPDFLLGSSLFADGAAAALVSARPPAGASPALELVRERSVIVPQGERDMAWDIGNEGFRLVLSSYVPEVLGANIESAISPFLQSENLTRGDINRWAVHPGGKAILDKVQASLSIPPDALRFSRDVLRNYGNMSSPTVLFVLKEMLRTPAPPGTLVCGMAFGPGLTVETNLLRHV